MIFYEQTYRNERPAVGLGEPTVAAPVVRAPSPWVFAVATSVISAATGWVIEEAARHVRKKRRRR